jgi:hypothetical protein
VERRSRSLVNKLVKSVAYCLVSATLLSMVGRFAGYGAPAAREVCDQGLQESQNNALVLRRIADTFPDDELLVQSTEEVNNSIAGFLEVACDQTDFPIVNEVRSFRAYVKFRKVQEEAGHYAFLLELHGDSLTDEMRYTIKEFDEVARYLPSYLK